MSQKPQQSQYGYLSHRPISPKLHQNQQTSSSNQHISSSNTPQSNKSQYDSDHINLVHKENSVLREENQALWR